MSFFGGLCFVRKIEDKTILVSIINTRDLPNGIESEHMYPLVGRVDDPVNTLNPKQMRLTFYGDEPTNVSTETMGESINQVLKKPLWKTT